MWRKNERGLKMRAIDGEELHNELFRLGGNISLDAFTRFERLILDAPTIDPVQQFEPQRKGVWLRHEKVVNGKVVYSDDTYVCSHCKDIWSSMTKMKFCPSCGTEMEYKDDE